MPLRAPDLALGLAIGATAVLATCALAGPRPKPGASAAEPEAKEEAEEEEQPAPAAKGVEVEELAPALAAKSGCCGGGQTDSELLRTPVMQAAAVRAGNDTLCPELIVPLGSEGSACVPIRALRYSTMAFEAFDEAGNSSLSVSADKPNELWARLPSGAKLFRCTKAEYPDEGFSIYRRDGSLYGRLAQGQTARDKLLITDQGPSLNFRSTSWDRYCVTVTDASSPGNFLVSTCEPCPAAFDSSGEEYLTLWAAPLADIGVLLSCLLSVYHLGDAGKAKK